MSSQFTAASSSLQISSCLPNFSHILQVSSQFTAASSSHLQISSCLPNFSHVYRWAVSLQLPALPVYSHIYRWAVSLQLPALIVYRFPPVCQASAISTGEQLVTAANSSCLHLSYCLLNFSHIYTLQVSGQFTAASSSHLQISSCLPNFSHIYRWAVRLQLPALPVYRFLPVYQTSAISTGEQSVYSCHASSTRLHISSCLPNFSHIYWWAVSICHASSTRLHISSCLPNFSHIYRWAVSLQLPALLIADFLLSARL